MGWLNTAAGQAAQAASRGAASGERGQRATLVISAVVPCAGHGFVTLWPAQLAGQDAPGVAAAEAEYEQIWAQDVAAMFSVSPRRRWPHSWRYSRGLQQQRKRASPVGWQEPGQRKCERRRHR